MADKTAAERQRRHRKSRKDAGIVDFWIGITEAQRLDLKLAAAVNGETMEQNAKRRLFGDDA